MGLRSNNPNSAFDDIFSGTGDLQGTDAGESVYTTAGPHTWVAPVKIFMAVVFSTILSLLTMIAMLPLVIGNIGPGAGEGSRLAVGATILGGMIISTFFTLYVTPTMYLALAKNTKRIDAVDIELKKQLN